MNNELSNPFEFEYDEKSDSIVTKSNLKFYREYDNLEKTKEYIKINFSIYKIDKSIDWFTWLNEPDSETNYQIELFFELEEKYVNVLKKIIIDFNKNNLESDFNKNNLESNCNLIQLDKYDIDDSWFISWHLNSRFSTEKIKLNDTYIPTSIEYVRFV